MGTFRNLVAKAAGIVIKPSVDNLNLSDKEKRNVMAEVLFEAIAGRFSAYYSFTGPFWVNRAFIKNKDYIINNIDAKVRTQDILVESFECLDYVKAFVSAMGFGEMKMLTDDSGQDVGFIVSGNYGEVTFKTDILIRASDVDKYALDRYTVLGDTPTASLVNMFIGALTRKDNYWYAILFYELTRVESILLTIKDFKYYVKRAIPDIYEVDCNSVLMSGDFGEKINDSILDVNTIVDRFISFYNVIVNDDNVSWDCKTESFV